MADWYLLAKQGGPLQGELSLGGAKNAVLVIMASLLLTRGTSRLKNVPASSDVLHMMELLRSLGAHVSFDQKNNTLEIDTSFVNKWRVSPDSMRKMRASILVMGPLLVRFSKAEIALPGGCVIGERPIDYHLKNFIKMGVSIAERGAYLNVHTNQLCARELVLDYPSVGATENLMMAAVCTSGTTMIINAALEPEVLDLIEVLKKMGAQIRIVPPAGLEIIGVSELQPIEHEIMVDRLEAGVLLLAAAITGGSVSLPTARADHLDLFLLKLEEMGHKIIVGENKRGITLAATDNPQAISFKTAPYPGFPTDLQAPMMAMQCIAQGKSVIEETVFENRLLHVRELQKMGAQIDLHGNQATITGVDELYGAQVIATDIRASSALVLAGLVAKGSTVMTGIHHWLRGYERLELKLSALGADIEIRQGDWRHIKTYQHDSLSSSSF